MRVAVVYQDGLQDGGYPRDVRWLVGTLQGIGVDARLVCSPGHKSDGLSADLVINPVAARSDDWDIVHHFGLLIPRQWTVSLRLKRRALVISPAAQLMHWHMQKARRKKLTYMHLIRRFVPHDAMAHVFSRHELYGVHHYLGIDQTFEAPVGIPPMHEEESPSGTSEGSLVFFGRNDIHQKGLDLLLEAYARSVKNGLEQALVIGGRPFRGSEQFIHSRVLALGLQDRVTLLGELASRAKWELLRGARCLVFLSRWDGPPRPVREAIAVATPVIVSWETNMGELVTQFGAGRAVSLEREDIAEALLLTASSDNCDRWKAGTGRLRRSLDWANVAQAYAEGYECALRSMTARG